MQTNILITGASGFLASALHSLLSKNPEFRLYGISRQNSSLIKGYSQVFKTIDELIESDIVLEHIYFLSGHIPYGAYNQPDSTLFEANAEQAYKLSVAFPKARIVYASSIAVYGTPLSLPISENSPFNNPTLYGLSKLAGELAVKTSASYAILRFSSLIGKGMKPITIFPKMIVEAKSTKKIQVYGDGSRLQSYLDVNDAAKMCLCAMNSTENFVALGVGKNSLQNKELAEIIARKTNAEVSFIGSDTSPSFQFDASLSWQLLNFTPEISIETSIEHFINS